MGRFAILLCLPFLLQCQSSSFEEELSVKRYESTNRVVKGSSLPDLIVHEELRPYLIDFVEGKIKLGSGLDLFSGLRSLKLVPSFKNKQIVASCHSFQLLERDSIEDNLLSLSAGWVEISLLEREYAPSLTEDEGLLKEKIHHVLSHCFSEYEALVGIQPSENKGELSVQYGMK